MGTIRYIFHHLWHVAGERAAFHLGLLLVLSTDWMFHLISHGFHAPLIVSWAIGVGFLTVALLLLRTLKGKTQDQHRENISHIERPPGLKAALKLFDRCMNGMPKWLTELFRVEAMWAVVVATIALLLSLQWAASSLFASMEECLPNPLACGPNAWRIVSAVAFACIAVWVSGPAERLTIRNYVPKDESVPPHPYLAIYLSWDDEATDNIENWIQFKHRFQTLSLWNEHKSKLADDLVKLAKNQYHWSWEQALWAIDHHTRGRTLERLYIVVSKESKTHVKFFCEIVRGYDIRDKNEQPIKIIVAGTAGIIEADGRDDLSHRVKNLEAASFEDFDELYKATHGVLNHVGGAEHDKLVIDVTGGQKPTSIVAALCTINLPTRVQYVQTGQSKQVQGYGLRAAPKPGAG
ncbi:MAG: hypothetical protein ACREVK_00925 [Gammaproteobacteria bacterium]